MHTPLLFRKSIKSGLLRNFTAGDCERLAPLDIDAKELDDGVGPEAVEGVDGEDGLEGVDGAWDEGLDEAAPVCGLPLMFDSPAVRLSLLLSTGSGTREWRLPRPRSVRRKLWYLEGKKVKVQSVDTSYLRTNFHSSLHSGATLPTFYKAF